MKYIPLLIAVGLATTSAGQAQQLTLRNALLRAEAGAYANRIATAEANAERARSWQALRGILPTVRLEVGYVRTTDPIGAFGIALRQRTIEQADFDPQRLNYPAPASNYSGGVVVEAPLLNVDAHLGRMAGTHAGRAASASAAWTAAKTRVEVIRAYYGAVLTAENLRTLEAALKAANAHVRQAELMVKNGLATRSDALLASVKAAELQTRLAEVTGDAQLARAGLAVLLGADAAELGELPAALPTIGAVRAVLDTSATERPLQERGDVSAARSGLRAARTDAARAASLYLPRLNAVARYDWNSPDGLYDGDKNWTIGLMATWTPFAGASEIAERRGAAARTQAAQAGFEAARAQAELELSRARLQRDVALQRLQIAENAVQQSREAHRIVARKYQGGLATAIELLEAAAIQTQTEVALSQARYAGIVAAAEDLKARGADPAALADLLTRESSGASHEAR